MKQTQKCKKIQKKLDFMHYVTYNMHIHTKERNEQP